MLLQSLAQRLEILWASELGVEPVVIDNVVTVCAAWSGRKDGREIAVGNA